MIVAAPVVVAQTLSTIPPAVATSGDAVVPPVKPADAAKKVVPNTLAKPAVVKPASLPAAGGPAPKPATIAAIPSNVDPKLVVPKPVAKAPAKPAQIAARPPTAPVKTVSPAVPAAAGVSTVASGAAAAPSGATSRNCANEATEKDLSGADRVAFYKECVRRK